MEITYTEVRELLKKVREETEHKIVDVCITAERPLTLEQISEAVGASMSAVSSWAQDGNWVLTHYANKKGVIFHREKKTTETLYINPLDPNDMVTIKRTRTYCWVSRC